MNEKRSWAPAFSFILLVAIMAFGSRSRGDEAPIQNVQGASVVTLQAEAPVFILQSETEEIPVQPEEKEVVVKTETKSIAPTTVSPPPTSQGVFLRRSETAPPELRAYAAGVADLETGELYFEKRPDARWPMASITKLMTAVAVRDLIPGDTVLTITGSDVSSGNALTREIGAGDVYSADDLLGIMLLVSSNEIANLFARHAGYEAFLGHMNQKAGEWGIRATFFKDPSGIAAANQSTVKDLIVLARNLYKEYPDILNITTQKNVTVRETQSGIRKTFSSINLFAGEYDFLGGKTGQTPEAGANLLSVFSYGGRQVVVIVLGTEDRFGESSRLYQWFIHDFIPNRSN